VRDPALARDAVLKFAVAVAAAAAAAMVENRVEKRILVEEVVLCVLSL
jgi:hypothetical protein